MKLVPIHDVYPSAYNPRVSDPKRLDLIELSLRKLGFLLPLYADANGELLSGHQRHLVAERMGLTQLPVEYSAPMELEDRRNINVVFNRATNDLDMDDTPTNLTEALERSDVFKIAEAMPDKTGDELYPCLHVQAIPLDDLIAANRGKWVDYARNITQALARKGIIMPIVAKKDRTIVNGIGRLNVLAMQKEATAQVVFITDQEAALADAMLNLLSMDFDLHTRYADILRHNSFRRITGAHPDRLGQGTTWALGIQANQLDTTDAEHIALWRKKFGGRVLDFGAGRLDDVRLLRKAGIEADAFEPYVCRQNNEIDPVASRVLTEQFLKEVAGGKQWQSIFLNAVFNSVPFHADREHIVRLIAALCGPRTKFYTYTSGITSSSNKRVKGAKELHSNANKSTQFSLTYEKNVVLGEFASMPKMQKYFTLAEFTALLRLGFREVKAEIPSVQNSVVAAVCQKPRALDRQALRAAIAFEFDMPYPDGSRLGMVEEALQAYSQRLGVSL